MIKKTRQHSMKLLRRFDEDIWGNLAISNKNSKTLNYIFESYKNNFKIKNLLRNRRFLLSKKNYNFLYKVNKEEKEFKRKKRTIKINNYINRIKLRRFYGNIGERQIKSLLRRSKLSSNILSRSFFYFLESRLDTILYRSNLFDSIYHTRQVINHKKIYVNGKLVNKPGFIVSVGDIIHVSDYNLYYINLKQKLQNKKILCNYPSYLEINYKLGAITLIKLPESHEVPFPFFMSIHSIIYDYLK